MAILVICTRPNCGEIFDVPDAAGGTQVSCPACGAAQLVPAGQAEGPQPVADVRLEAPQAEKHPEIPLAALLTPDEAPDDARQAPSLSREAPRPVPAKAPPPTHTDAPTKVQTPAPVQAGQGRPSVQAAQESLGEPVDETLPALLEEGIASARVPPRLDEGVLELKAGTVLPVVAGYVGIAVGLAASLLLAADWQVAWAYAGAAAGWAAGFVFALMVMLSVDDVTLMVARCAVCGNVFSPGTESCRFCGSLSLAPTISPLVADCVTAGASAAGGPGEVYWLAVLAAVVALGWEAFVYLRSLLTGELSFLRPWLAVPFAAAGLVILGYWAARLIRQVGEGLSDPSEESSARASRRLGAGLAAAAIAAMYVLPLVTLPLMPLAVLAAGEGRWSVAVNPLAALNRLRAAGKGFVLLWLVLLLWVGVMALAIAALLMAAYWLSAAIPHVDTASRLAMSLAVEAISAAMVGAVAGAFSLAACRCIGLFGRHYPWPGGRAPQAD